MGFTCVLNSTAFNIFLIKAKGLSNMSHFNYNNCLKTANATNSSEIEIRRLLTRHKSKALTFSVTS